MLELMKGDCLKVLRTLESRSIDACVTDPPYGLSFMGKAWDHGVPGVLYWKRIYRVLKPGAYLVAFGGTRTYHRMVCAIEDAGFEIRDSLMWVYGTGFPKSLNAGSAIDLKIARESGVEFGPDDDIPTTPEGDPWRGFGTALKPAFEPIVLARKPLSESTVAANVLRWGTGALNIGACRVPCTDPGGRPNIVSKSEKSQNTFGDGLNGSRADGVTSASRWPANICHDGSEEVVGAFPDSNGSGAARKLKRGKRLDGDGWGMQDVPGDLRDAGTGSAARFFYCTKANKHDRNGSKHPTVKPIALKRYLAKLITPPGGIVLDPFAGSGTTAAACKKEKFDCILIEKNKKYCRDIERRLENLAKKKKGFFE